MTKCHPAKKTPGEGPPKDNNGDGNQFPGNGNDPFHRPFTATWATHSTAQAQT